MSLFLQPPPGPKEIGGGARRFCRLKCTRKHGQAREWRVCVLTQDSEGVVCMCCWVSVCVCVCVCVCARARARAPSICVRENLYWNFLNFICVSACNKEDTSHTSSRVDRLIVGNTFLLTKKSEFEGYARSWRIRRDGKAQDLGGWGRAGGD